jgi:hypothetical protein
MVNLLLSKILNLQNQDEDLHTLGHQHQPQKLLMMLDMMTMVISMIQINMIVVMEQAIAFKVIMVDLAQLLQMMRHF